MLVTISLYKKHLAFWTALAAILGSGYFLLKHPPTLPTTTAEPDSEFFRDSQGTGEYRVKLLENGATTLNNFSTKQTIFPGASADYFRLKILDENPEQFDALTVAVDLPKQISGKGLNAQGLIIHSYSNEVQVSYPSNTRILFTAYDVAPLAVFTITFDLPKGYLDLPLAAVVKSYLAILPAPLWLAAGLFAPLAALSLAAIQLARRAAIFWHLRQTPINPNLPTALPPAVVGAAQRGAITNRELSATLVDLAVHNNIYLFANSNGEFTFAQTTLYPNRPFEKALLSKIFYERQPFARRTDVLYRVGHRLFSEKVAKFYWEIYRFLDREGYFASPPGKTIYRWRAAGAALFFVGVVGFFIGVLFFPEPKFPLVLWLGVIAVSGLITRFAPLMLYYSSKGFEALRRWRGFEKYLSLSKPVSFAETQDNRLWRYLPYAVVFGVERQWLDRFASFPFVPPRWFDSNERAIGLERFTQLIMPITTYVARLLAASRQPVV